jgi:hypothetical protein
MRALSLLRTDLDARVSAGKTDKLDDWKTDPDFKTVREDAAALPEAERTEWTQLWKDVDACIARLR